MKEVYFIGNGWIIENKIKNKIDKLKYFYNFLLFSFLILLISIFFYKIL